MVDVRVTGGADEVAAFCDWLEGELDVERRSGTYANRRDGGVRCYLSGVKAERRDERAPKSDNCG